MNPRLVLLFLFALAARVAPAQTADADARRSDLLRTDAHRIEALLHADVVALKALLADDCVYVHSSGKVQTREEYLGLLAAGTLAYDSIRYEAAPRIRFYGADTAIISGRVLTTAKTRTSSPNQRVLVATAVYVRQDARWRLVNYQSTAVP